MQVAVLGGAGASFAARGAGGGLDARSQRAEDRIEPFDGLGLAADHHAEATLQAEHAAAGADIDVADAPLGERRRPVDVVAVVAVAAVDEDIALVEMLGHIGDDAVGDAGGDHDPGAARGGEPCGEIGQVLGAGRALLDELLDGGRVDVEHHALVTVAHQAPHDVGAHTSQADHSQLHSASPQIRCTAQPTRDPVPAGTGGRAHSSSCHGQGRGARSPPAPGRCAWRGPCRARHPTGRTG